MDRDELLVTLRRALDEINDDSYVTAGRIAEAIVWLEDDQNSIMYEICESESEFVVEGWLLRL